MQQSSINYDLVLEQSIFFLVIFVVCFIGAYTKDTLDTIRGKEYSIKYNKITFSSLVVAIGIWGFQDKITSHLGGFKQLIAFSVFMGLISYDLTTRLTEWEFVKRALSSLGVKVIDALIDARKDSNKKK